MELSETEVRSRFIRPAIVAARWEDRQIREEVYFTDGRMIVRGQMSMRGQRKYADFLLYHKPNLPLAIVEAKKNTWPWARGCSRPWNTPSAWTFPLSTAATARALWSTTARPDGERSSANLH